MANEPSLSSNYNIYWESHQGTMGLYLGLGYSSLESCNFILLVFYNQFSNHKYKISKSDTLNDHLWCSTRHLKGQHYDNLDILVEIWKAGIYRGQGSQVCCCCCCVASVVSDSVRPHKRQPIRLPHPWDSPGKNTGVGCHFLLQCMKVKRESEVAQLCPTLVTPWSAAYQAPPSMGFSRQKYWSGVPLPSLDPRHTSQ